MNIKVPKPGMSLKGKADFVTEIAFNSLLAESVKLGLSLNPVMGLMYLPDQALTRQFQEACRNILTSLGAGDLNI
jgi:hypothetical protein